MLKPIERFMLGLFAACFFALALSLVVSPCAASVIKPAIVTVTQPCVREQLSRPLMEVLTDARRLMVRDGWEYGGVIFMDDKGALCVGGPATSQHPTRLLKLWGLPRGWKVIALYHTHPGLAVASHDFSSTDTLSMCQQNVTSFIVAEDGVVTRLDPHPLICDRDIIGPARGRIVGVVQL